MRPPFSQITIMQASLHSSTESPVSPRFRLLSVAEAAKIAGISPRLLREQIAIGQGPAPTRVGRGSQRYLIRDDLLYQWLADRTSL